MSGDIAIVGMACRYPDARTPLELWENVLAQRRAFRRLPSERLSESDYFSRDRSMPDKTYSMQGAVIEGFEFDRVSFRVSGETYRSADLAHWVALDVASRALADAGFEDGADLPKRTTGVHLGNTLTGEFSRAAVMRVRWPYVRRIVQAQLEAEGWSPERLCGFLADLEAQYKRPFAPVGAETLAGGLSNTIAGRVCNHFDLKGGGYTVDGACASSLLAVISSCTAIAAGDLDVAITGGVDLSLDPFELVGFAKTGALAPDLMRIYDERSGGFWPGEGCGFLVLMRRADAVAQGRRIYAVIEGWGVSSDGSGGITRPDLEGQGLALERAYRRAGFAMDTVGYFEGHGTGTAVGDATELEVLSTGRRRISTTGLDAPPATIGSVKANIGHTKAAAGVAGLIKATMAVHRCMLPPTTGCERPHRLLGPGPNGEAPALRVLARGEAWPEDLPRRAAVSAMGFGGINTHVVIDGAVAGAGEPARSDEGLLRSAQDAELLLFAAPDHSTLRAELESVLAFADRISLAEVTDLAAELARSVAQEGTGGVVRAAIVASTPAEIVRGLERLCGWVTEGITERRDLAGGVFLGGATGAEKRNPRIGFVFPGQGSPVHRGGGALERRFDAVEALYEQIKLPGGADDTATEIAQPAIVASSIAGLRILAALGVEAVVAAGHSLGELTALHWAGGYDETALLRIATARGAAMGSLPGPTGAMANITGTREQVESLLAADPALVIAGLNAPKQTVVSGPASAIKSLEARAAANGIRVRRLPVSHAFHSPLVAAATASLLDHLATESFAPLERRVLSTITGGPLDGARNGPLDGPLDGGQAAGRAAGRAAGSDAARAGGEGIEALLAAQVTSPVRFTDVTRTLIEATDLLVEVGPGHVMSGLLREAGATEVVSIDAGGPSLAGLLKTAGAAFALGTNLDVNALFGDAAVGGRFARSFSLNWNPSFLANPCESAPLSGDKINALIAEFTTEAREAAAASEPRSSEESGGGRGGSPISVLREVVAAHAELPIESVRDDDRMLSDLHLNSITVGLLVTEAARRLSMPPPAAPTEFADASIADIAAALESMPASGASSPRHGPPPGVETWVRAFTVDLVERPLAAASASAAAANDDEGGRGAWTVLAPRDHPLAAPLLELLQRTVATEGVLVCLPPDPAEAHIPLLMEGARLALARREMGRFVLVQHGGGGASVARTLHIESPNVTTCVVDVPAGEPRAVEWIAAEAAAARGYVEAHYDSEGRRRQPVARHLSLHELPESVFATRAPLGKDDVILVTGGGKGIAAESALALARESGARLVLMGRSEPAGDSELARNLQRFADAGVRFHYAAADLNDAAAVQAALRSAQMEMGVITVFLHGAGINEPRALAALTPEDIRRTLGAKVCGARHVLSSLDAKRLRLLITFGSIIARTGMEGEGDYALANEWLGRVAARWRERNPHCQCVNLEWSIWSGVGMGQRLGRIDALHHRGITAITPDEGVSILSEILRRELPATDVIVSGRFGDPPTLRMDRRDLPLRRFLERPRVYVPGVEIVAEAVLTAGSDPYLDDHVFRGRRIFPAVIGMEAMAQVAAAVVESGAVPNFEHVRFERPVIIPDDGSVTVRIAALQREPGVVDVVLRSSETEFQFDHCRAVCRFEGDAAAKTSGAEPFAVANDVGLGRDPDHRADRNADDGHEGEFFRGRPGDADERAASNLDPSRDLYGGILFHGGRFRRLEGYRHLSATACAAEISSADNGNWFGELLPPGKVLGDPGARDALIHSIQACLPHFTLLPVGVDRVVPDAGAMRRPHVVTARERERDGDLFTYDVVVTDAEGRPGERWEGLRLKAVDETPRSEAWAPPLLGVWLERRVQELIGVAGLSVAVRFSSGCAGEHDSGIDDVGARLERNERIERNDRSVRSDSALREVAASAQRDIAGATTREQHRHHPDRLHHRPDGKPVTDGGVNVSASHAGDLTIAVGCRLAAVACDVEPVLERSAETWRDLLSSERGRLAHLIECEIGESASAASTRVWAATECLTKAGVMLDGPLTFESSTDDGWVVLSAGDRSIATVVTSVCGVVSPLAIALLVDRGG